MIDFLFLTTDASQEDDSESLEFDESIIFHEYFAVAR